MANPQVEKEIKNNFFISVSNGLLTEEHINRIGSSIWQFLWCLDKVTKIDNDGIGIVLGGKPIQLKDLPGGHRVTVSRNLTNLEKEGYIKMTHTPYGIVIKVMKMKKRFNKNVKPQTERINKSAKVGLTKTLNHMYKNAKPVCENAKPNKTVTVDNNKDTTERQEITPSKNAKFFFKGVQDLIEKNQSEESAATIKFLQALESKYPGATKGAIWREIKKFESYWTELNQSGTKQRWQLQEAFQVDRRLGTWFGKVKEFEKKVENNKGKYETGIVQMKKR